MHIHVCAVNAELPVSKRKWNEIAEETETDEVLKQPPWPSGSIEGHFQCNVELS